MIDHSTIFELELFVRFVGPSCIFGIGFRRVHAGLLFSVSLFLPIPLLTWSCHIKHADAVAMMIVPTRFDFDVLADHVETRSLQELDIRTHRFFARRSQQTIWPQP